MKWLQVFLFGITLALAIGPIALLIMNTALRDGPKAGIHCALGATTADFLFALAAFSASAVIAPILTAHQHVLGTVAAFVLIVLGGHLLWRSWRPKQTARAASPQRHYWSTLLLTIINPLTVLAFAGLALQWQQQLTAVDIVLLAITAALGSGGVAIVLALLAAQLRHVVTSSRTVRLTNMVSASGILLFGVWGMLRSVWW